MSTWTCAKCQHSYHSDDGDLRHGVLPGTPWEALPEDWVCPDCKAPKFEFRQTADGTRDGSGWTAHQ
jgi:rubredoxin